LLLIPIFFTNQLQHNSTFNHHSLPLTPFRTHDHRNIQHTHICSTPVSADGHRITQPPTHTHILTRTRKTHRVSFFLFVSALFVGSNSHYLYPLVLYYFCFERRCAYGLKQMVSGGGPGLLPPESGGGCDTSPTQSHTHTYLHSYPPSPLLRVKHTLALTDDERPTSVNRVQAPREQ
jgi:hypothetical protein